MGSGAEEGVISPTLLWTASMSVGEFGLDIVVGVERRRGGYVWVSALTVRWMFSEGHEISEVTYAMSATDLLTYPHLC